MHVFAADGLDFASAVHHKASAARRQNRISDQGLDDESGTT
jgi:hypothetical protein